MADGTTNPEGAVQSAPSRSTTFNKVAIGMGATGLAVGGLVGGGIGHHIGTTEATPQIGSHALENNASQQPLSREDAEGSFTFNQEPMVNSGPNNQGEQLVKAVNKTTGRTTLFASTDNGETLRPIVNNVRDVVWLPQRDVGEAQFAVIWNEDTITQGGKTALIGGRVAIYDLEYNPKGNSTQITKNTEAHCNARDKFTLTSKQGNAQNLYRIEERDAEGNHQFVLLTANVENGYDESEPGVMGTQDVALTIVNKNLP